MTISSKETGNLYLNEKTFQISNGHYGLVNLTVMGYTQGMGGYVIVKTEKTEKRINVGPCEKVVIFGEEFWGEYSDHPKKQKAVVSLVYP